MLSPADLQRQTLRLYGELLCRRSSLAGELVLAAGAGSAQTGLAAAVSIAGGATLVVDADAAEVKAVLRSGGLDFVVSSLDEALRALKNELRKHRPLGVGLIAPVQPVLQEMVERGVLPTFEVALGSETPASAEDTFLQAMAGWGMQRLNIPTLAGIAQPTVELAAWLNDHGWTETHHPIDSLAALRTLDQSLLHALSETDLPRHLWLQRIGHYQRPSTAAGRTLWSSPG